MKRTICAVGLIMLSFFFLLGTASADEYHYQNLLVGDRASGMGGAYTAISDDATGLYYNPAGIVYSSGRNLSASVNAYYNMTKEYDSVIGGNGWERKSTSLLPNFFGIIQPLGKFKFGFSYAVPDSVFEDQDQIFLGSFPTSLGSPAVIYIINFNNEDNTYLVGPSLAMEITSKFSAGLTLYLHHRSAHSILNQHITLADGKYEWTNQYIEKVERGYKPVLGVMFAPMEKLSLGLSIAKTLIYGFSENSQLIFKDALAASPDDVTVTFAGNASKPKNPWEIKLGAAYFPSSNLLLSFDTAYYTKVSDPDRGDKVSVVNIALGSEYFMSKSWAVRGGLYTNLANTPDLDAARFNQDEKIDLYGMSLSVSNFTRNTAISLGGSVSMGSGKAQIVSNTTAMQDADIMSWMLFLSSSYSY